MQITKAIIPVAGYGARRLPITKVIEKCMLPIGNRPLVDYIVADCLMAGIKDIYFIVSNDNSQLQAYYSENKVLNDYLIAGGKQDMLELVQPPKMNFHYIVQKQGGKYGTAIPVSLAAPMVQPGESVVVLMGDDFIYNSDGSSETARLLAATPEGGCSLMGVNVPADQVFNYGVLKFDADSNFEKIIERPAVGEAPSTMINVSKYVINYDLLKLVANHAGKTLAGEYYIVDPINEYVTGGGIVKVIPATGQYLDGGSLDGWLHANNVVAGRDL